jgi:hypothetical protein
MTHESRAITYSASDAEEALTAGRPAPATVFFSCYSGDFTRAAPCHAESQFFLRGGPVAVIAATTESHPLTNALSGMATLQSLSAGHQRLGEFWLASQKQAIKARNLLLETVLRDVEGKLEPQINVGKLRRDQILMYALLGDPATRLRVPETLKVALRRTDAGWDWRAERPAGAVRLLVGHRRAAPPPATRPPGATPEQARAAFRTANAVFAFSTLPSPPDEGPWQGTVNEPGRLRLVAVSPRTLRVGVVELKPD